MDLYTLAVSIDPNGIVSGVARGGAALDQLGAKAEQAAKKVEHSSGVSASAFLRMGAVTEHLRGSLEELLVMTGAGVIAEKLIEETIEAQNAFAQLEAAVKSTGGSAGLTAAELKKLAEDLQGTSTYTDDAVMSAESMLLTFDKIRGVRFEEATRAVVDLAARMGGDLQGAAIQVGKALQDPATGLTALRRSGVSFSEAQIQVIKDLYDTGQVAKGQAIILAELTKEFGNSAAAARDTLGGALKGLLHDFADLFKVTREGSGGVIGVINSVGEGVKIFGEHLAAAGQVAVVVAGVLAARYVAGLLDANAATIQMRTQVALGNAVMLDSVTAQRGAAAAAVDRAKTQQGASASTLASLRAEEAEVLRLIAVEQERAAAARAAAGAVAFRVAPSSTGSTGPAADYYAQREALAQNTAATAARTEALAAESAAVARVNALEEQHAAVLVQVTEAEAALTTTTAATTVAMEAEAVVIAETTVAARALAVAAEAGSVAMAALGGPIGVAILAALALNAALDAYIDRQAKANEQTDAQRAATDAALDSAHKRAAAEKAAAQEARDAEERRKSEIAAVAKLGAERTSEIAKLRALNDAYDLTEKEQKLVGVAYDAMIQKSKDAREHHGGELTTLNALTDAMTAQKVRAIELADAKEKLLAQREREKDEAMGSDDAYVTRQLSAEAIEAERDKEQRLTEARKAGVLALQYQEDEEEVYQRLIDAGIQQGDEQYEQVEREIRQIIRLRHERENQAQAEQTIDEANKARREKAQQEQGKDSKRLLEQMQSDLSTFFGNLLTKGISTWRDLFTSIKNMFLKLLADMIAASMVKRVAGVLGGLMGSAATAGAQGTGGAGSTNPLGAVDAWGGQIAKTAGAGIVGGFAGYAVGQSLYSSSHGTAGNYVRGALGGAAAGAATGAMIAGPAGAAVGAVAGLIGGIIGIGNASKEAAKQMADMQKAVALSMASLRATVNHDSVAQGIADIDADRETRRKAIEDAYSGGGAGSEQVQKRNAALREMNALEDARIAQLRDEAALQKQYAKEDLQVRLLAAQGKKDEADALALANAQAREYADYVKQGADDATLALLLQVQAQEKLAAATTTATASALNMVSGYRLQAAVFNASGSAASGASFTPTRLSSSMTPQGGDGATGDLTANIVLDGRIVGTTVLRDFKRRARKKGGSVTANVLTLDEQA